ncbi:MAG: hypothetical protein Q8M15_12680 [Bacteroidota bacterium]|nr:hypothetical protein [Bacteroidota bacterium]
MKSKINLLKLYIGLFLFFCIGLVMQGCGQSHSIILDESNGGTALIGTWSGKQSVQVRYSTGFMKFRFVESGDSLVTLIQIDKEGKVSGSIGNAKMSDCRVIKNRGAVGRKLNLATDFSIRGKLEGFIFEGDTIASKDIAIPFEIKSDKLQGSVFHKIGMDVFPMLGLDLKKK